MGEEEEKKGPVPLRNYQRLAAQSQTCSFKVAELNYRRFDYCSSFVGYIAIVDITINIYFLFSLLGLVPKVQ